MALDMDYCAPRGIPHSEFLRWDDDDREKAVWWSIRERQRCGSCGTHPDDWDPEQGGSRHAFKPQIRWCPGCHAVAQGEAELDKQRNAGVPMHGRQVVLIRTVEGGEDVRHEG